MYNLTIAALAGAAAYIGTGETSVFAVYESQRPTITEIVQVAEVVQPIAHSSYVTPVAEAGPIVMASYTSATTQIAPTVDAVPEITSPLELLSATVTGQAVNLRLGPSTDFDKIGAVALGDELVLTGKRDGTWVQVQHPVDGSPVWISEKFIN